MISGAICEQKGVKFQLIGWSSDELCSQFLHMIDCSKDSWTWACIVPPPVPPLNKLDTSCLPSTPKSLSMSWNVIPQTERTSWYLSTNLSSTQSLKQAMTNCLLQQVCIDKSQHKFELSLISSGNRFRDSETVVRGNKYSRWLENSQWETGQCVQSIEVEKMTNANNQD